MAAPAVYTTLILLVSLYTSEAYLEEQGEGVRNEKRLLDDITECREEHMPCRAVPKCCGELVCYWPNGFSPFKDGLCIDCVKEGRKCQRDSQCCENLQCDKSRLLKVDGVCRPLRTKGECYRDKQCVSECVKKWYQFKGECS